MQPQGRLNPLVRNAVFAAALLLAAIVAWGVWRRLPALRRAAAAATPAAQPPAPAPGMLPSEHPSVAMVGVKPLQRDKGRGLLQPPLRPAPFTEPDIRSESRR